MHIDIDNLVSRHFAVLGATGVGKSSGVAIILQKILDTRPNLRIFLVDPHNEYGRCFGDKAQVLTPRNLRLPFWLFNFEETIDAFFGGRPGVEEEIEILSDVIPLAKAAYLQYRPGAAASARSARRRIRATPASPPTRRCPTASRTSSTCSTSAWASSTRATQRVTIHRLMTRIQTFRNHPRYAFMFENANIGGDTMAEILGNLFRLPPNGKPMTIMQLAGFPAEVIDSVVSVLCRMAFDFGLWSDGVAPLLFVCEEAHRYAPADKKIGFGPTRRALSRIAKEGRKYGVFLGLVTQRPAEIDPTIISQCSTLFCMRLSNERDQALIRSAVSDAAPTCSSFIPSLGVREVFTFGPGVAVPTRMRFNEIDEKIRPNSEAAGNTRSDVGTNISRDLMSGVIDRWRSASMSHRSERRRRLYLAARCAGLAAFGAARPAAVPAFTSLCAVVAARGATSAAAACGEARTATAAKSWCSPRAAASAAGTRRRAPKPAAQAAGRRQHLSDAEYAAAGQHAQHARSAVALPVARYLRPTRSISADIPAWPEPSSTTLSCSLISSEEKSAKARSSSSRV